MFYTVNKNVISGPLGVGWGMSIAFDMEAVSNMETEAADCRRLAAKFKLKAECARLSATIALFWASSGATCSWHNSLRRLKSYAAIKVLRYDLSGDRPSVLYPSRFVGGAQYWTDAEYLVFLKGHQSLRKSKSAPRPRR